MSAHLLKGIKAVGKSLPTGPAKVERRGYGVAAQKVAKTGAEVRIPAYLLNASATKVSVLSNGMRVATEETAGETVTLGVHVDVGSAYETEKTNGVAHFFEHMAFKGTAKRSADDIGVEVENLGGQLNAYTSREQTAFVAKCFKKDVAQMGDLLADVLQNSKLDASLIERERSVILQEKEEVEKNLEEVVMDYLHAAAYQNTPLGYTILGEEKNIKSISRDDLVNYVRTHYTGKRMVLSAAGAVNHEELVKLAEAKFGGIPAQSSEYDASSLIVPEFIGSEIKVRDDTLHEVTAAVAFKGASWSDPDYLTFLLIQNFIGSWDRSMGGGNSLNSRLSEVTSNEALAHSFSAFNTSYHSSGLFGVSFVSPYDRVDEFCVEVMKEFSLLRSITPAELERAKNRVKSAYLMQLDGSSAIAEDIGRQLLTLGRRLTPIEAFLRIDAITMEDVQRVAWDSFRDVDPVVAAIGPLKYFPDYNVWRTRTTAL